MAAVWNITETELGQVDEYVAFSHSITYTDTDQYPTALFTVTLEAQEEQPETIFLSGNNITGYYSYVFDIDVTYYTNKRKYVTVKNFRDIDYEELYEVIKYVPDHRPNYTYNYIAKAYDSQGQLVATKNYTKLINNNWDLNKDLLIQYVNSTVITDPATFKRWINSINKAIVKWRSASNIEINWA